MFVISILYQLYSLGFTLSFFYHCLRLPCFCARGLIAGMIIYLCYGVWHSSERRCDDTQVILYDVADKDSMIVDGLYR